MIISLIAAMAENRVIGRGNAIPWNIPSDQKRFQKITMGHPVIFGRKTYDEIGRPLPGRKNIVLTRNRNYRAEGAVIVYDLDAALAAGTDTDEVFICGGGMVFQETIALARRIYLSIIHRKFEGDVLFPAIPGDFVEVKREEVKEEIPYAVVLYERKNK
jgi:dihydrofolate reductase